VLDRRDVDFSEKDQPLRSDVRALGALVGTVIREQVGVERFESVEEIRRAAIDRREKGYACSDLKAMLQGKSPKESRELVRAFSTYFQVVNLGEQIHRIRRGRAYLQSDGPPQSGSLTDTVLRLRSQGLSRNDIAQLFGPLQVEPVFTAHPTEATRRAILEKQQRIAARLMERLNSDRTLREERAAWDRIRAEVTSGWQTEEHPSVRPTVADEREHVLFYVANVLYGVVPAVHEALEEALDAAFPERETREAELPRAETPLVRFASWVGGDMDGNPNVGADSIREALARHRSLVLHLYLADLKPLARQLSQSASRVSWSKEVQERLDHYTELLPETAASTPERHRGMAYRALLELMAARIEATGCGGEGRYGDPHEFVADLQTVENSLLEHGGRHAGLFGVTRLRRRAQTFGFHLATLDVRQDARDHRDVMAVLLDDPDWPTRDAAARTDELGRLLGDAGTLGQFADRVTASPSVARCLEVFRAIGACQNEYGADAIGPFVVSMSENVDDVLTVMFLARVAGLGRADEPLPLDVAPLFETVPDLRGAAEVLKALFQHPVYAAHLEARGGRQTVMVGYSDSNKDGGIASARWSLQKAQRQMAEIATGHGVQLTVFHGRGGTVSRGGGKVHRAVAAAPKAALSGRLRLTEQGEVIDAKYGLPSIAIRNLERMLGAVALKTAEPEDSPASTPLQNAIAETIATASRAAYRNLVYDDPLFYSFFSHATPVDVIERMTIGSRPASRREGRGIGDLRAIPWVFSWTQNRAMTPGWYGVGAGLEAAVEEHGMTAVAEASSEWAFLGALLDDVEMVLAKADLSIAAEYVPLAPADTHGVFDRIREEFTRTCQLILAVKGADGILAGDSTLRRSIRLRNPYVDPMSLLQVDLLERWRAGGREDDALFESLLATVQGIARGLKNTG